MVFRSLDRPVTNNTTSQQMTAEPPPQHPFRTTYERLSPSAIGKVYNARGTYQLSLMATSFPTHACMQLRNPPPILASQEHRGSSLRPFSPSRAVGLSPASILLLLLLRLLFLQLRQARSLPMLRTAPFDDVKIHFDIFTRWCPARAAIV